MATTRGALVAVGSTRGVDAARRDGRARPRSSRFATPGRTARRRFPPDVARAAAVVAPPVASSGPKTIVLLSIHAKLPYGLMVGVVGDAEALVADWTSEEREYLRTAVTKDALQTPFRDGTVQDVAIEMVRISKEGLTLEPELVQERPQQVLVLLLPVPEQEWLPPSYHQLPVHSFQQSSN